MTETRQYDTAWEIREDGDGRTIEGLAVPYGVPSHVGSYTETIAPGAVDTAALPGRPLLYRHAEPIGVITSARDTPAGPVIRARISETTGGNDSLALVRDRAIRGLSIGFNTFPDHDQWSRDRQQVTRTLIDVTDVSLALFPAHPTAEILAVRERPTMPETTPEQLDEGRVTTLVRETITPDLTELREQVAKVRADIDADNRARHSHLPWANRGEFAREYFEALRNPERRPDFNRAVDDVLMSENTGLNPVSWMSSLINDVRVGRPLTEAIGVQPLPPSGLTVQWPTITTRPTTGDQASEQAEPSSTSMVIQYVSGTVFTEAGVLDLSWQSIDRSSPEALGALMSLYAEAYARRWDARVATYLATTTTGQAFATGAWSLAEIAGDLAAGAASIATAVGQAPNLLALAPNLYFNVALITGNGLPFAGGNPGNAQLGSLEFNLAGVKVICCPLMTDNTGYLLHTSSVKILESPGAPFSVATENPAIGSRTVGIYGYGALMSPGINQVVELTKTA